MRTILVVEDEPQIAGLVRDYLEHAGFAVLTAGDGAGALALARARRPDALVLDLGLPRVDGLDVIRALRRDSRVPILILSARGDEADRVTGLELGADDYVVKPFSPRELVARVRAVLRRAEATPQADERITAGDLELDLVRRRVTAGGRVVTLTPTEFELLATLAREPGRVWTRAQLLDAVHGFSLETYERAIDGHVRNLRRKLEPDDAAPRYVRTVHGVGYALADPDLDA
jgi:DNA-binding response OmpR family regulator